MKNGRNYDLTHELGPVAGAPLVITSRQDGGTPVPAPSIEMLAEQVERLKTIFPIGDVDVRFDTLPAFGFSPVPPVDVNKLLGEYYLLESAINPLEVYDKTVFRRVGGFLRGSGPPDGRSGGNAMNQVYSAYLSGDGAPTATGYARNRGPHEAAHSFGKEHAVVIGDPDFEPDDDPDRGGMIGLCGATASGGAGCS